MFSRSGGGWAYSRVKSQPVNCDNVYGGEHCAFGNGEEQKLGEQESQPFVSFGRRSTMPADEKGLLHSSRVRSRFDSVVLQNVGPFGWYQIRLLLVTQLPFVAVTPIFLCTLYDNIIPSQRHDTGNLSAIEAEELIDFAQLPIEMFRENVSSDGSTNPDFHSLIIDLGFAQKGSYFPTLLVTLCMAGAAVGSTVFGYAADRYGRRSSLIVSLLGCCLANGLLLGSVYLHWTIVAFMLFTIGLFAGGYMIVNLVLLMENVGKAWRLFCVSVGGWPLGLMSMALIGYATGRWDYFHGTLSLLCLASAIGYYFVYESPRWLMQHGRLKEAEDIISQVCRINGRSPITQFSLMAKAAEGGILDDDSSQNGKSALRKRSEEDTEEKVVTKRKYTYMDLVRSRTVFLRLSALSYSWFASALITMGIYFNMDSLAGNRYLNTFLTGLLKGTAAVIPVFLSPWMGRKPIFLVSVLSGCLLCWAAVIICLLDPSNSNSALLTACAIIGSACMDPMWKINNLYSAELFPTVVRNMARAVCSVWSRVGSILAPQVVYLSLFWFPSPFVVFGVVSIVQLVVALFLPETKGKSLPDRLLSPSSQKHRRHSKNDENAELASANC